MYLINKDETEYTGQETYVWDMYQQRCWDFFPAGECFRKQYEAELGGGGGDQRNLEIIVVENAMYCIRFRKANTNNNVQGMLDFKWFNNTSPEPFLPYSKYFGTCMYYYKLNFKVKNFIIEL